MTGVSLRIGTYARAGGRGLYRLDYDPNAGFTPGALFEEAANASFGAWSARHRLHYLVDEQAMGQLGAYRADAGEWRRESRISTDGREPCFVALDPDESRIAIANYGSGSVAVLALGPDGIPQNEGALWANNGGGPNADRQDGPHVHCVRFSPDGRWLYAVDLGTDQVLRFALDDAVPLEAAQLAYQAPAGSGPRHLLFHPTQPVALLVSELASTLSLFEVSGDGLSLSARCSTLPPGFAGESLGGHLAVNAAGDRVYVSNRGHDSIAVFGLDAATRADVVRLSLRAGRRCDEWGVSRGVTIGRSIPSQASPAAVERTPERASASKLTMRGDILVCAPSLPMSLSLSMPAAASPRAATDGFDTLLACDAPIWHCRGSTMRWDPPNAASRSA